jgi:hypothetical protein
LQFLFKRLSALSSIGLQPTNDSCFYNNILFVEKFLFAFSHDVMALDPNANRFILLVLGFVATHFKRTDFANILNLSFMMFYYWLVFFTLELFHCAFYCSIHLNLIFSLYFYLLNISKEILAAHIFIIFFLYICAFIVLFVNFVFIYFAVIGTKIVYFYLFIFYF